jgi:class 3 adenylate cyclase
MKAARSEEGTVFGDPVNVGRRAAHHAAVVRFQVPTSSAMIMTMFGLV